MLVSCRFLHKDTGLSVLLLALGEKEKLTSDIPRVISENEYASCCIVQLATVVCQLENQKVFLRLKVLLARKIVAAVCITAM